MKWNVVENSTGHIVNIIELSNPDGFNAGENYSLVEWQSGDEIYREIEQEDEHPVLTPAQFRYMLAIAGLYNVVNGVVEYLESNNHPMFAEVYGHLAGQEFNMDKTLEIITALRPLAEQLYPEADTSEENIIEKWNFAKEWNR